MMAACRKGHGYPYSWGQVQDELTKRNRGRPQGKRFTAHRCGKHWHLSSTATGHWPPKNRELDYHRQQEDKS